MGDIFHFPKNKENKNIKNQDVVTLKSMINSNIKVNVRVFPEELHAILRVLLKEQKETRALYHDAVLSNDKKEIEYWNTIEKILKSLVKKFKGVKNLDNYLEELSFAELDCLVGSVENSLQETYLLELQLIEDEIPLVTQLLKQSYDKIIPIYQKERKLFEKEKNDKD